MCYIDLSVYFLSFITKILYTDYSTVNIIRTYQFPQCLTDKIKHELTSIISSRASVMTSNDVRDNLSLSEGSPVKYLSTPSLQKLTFA